MRSAWRTKKSRLSPSGKAIAAAIGFLDLIEKRVDEKGLGIRLRAEIGLQWTWLTCIQHLAGKEALAALSALPANWSNGSRSRGDLLVASLLAARAVANARPDGRPLCASRLAESLKGGGSRQL